MLHSTLLALGVLAFSSVNVEAQTNGSSTQCKFSVDVLLPLFPYPPFPDPTKDCEPYYYPDIANALASFPPIWELATILPGDDVALQKWQSIQANVPNTPPKVFVFRLHFKLILTRIRQGTMQGNIENEVYGEDDPDCWWTWSKCTTPKASGIPPDVSILPEVHPYHLYAFGFTDFML